jgi:hypothetical protein
MRAVRRYDFGLLAAAVLVGAVLNGLVGMLTYRESEA